MIVNEVILIGRTTKPIELRYTTGEYPVAVAHFTLAVDRKKKEETDFISCVAFGKIAELMDRYVLKGHMVAIRGRIQVNTYKDKDGNSRWATDVVAEKVKFLESKNKLSQSNVPEGFTEADIPY